jgi:hypothetical protein
MKGAVILEDPVAANHAQSSALHASHGVAATPRISGVKGDGTPGRAAVRVVRGNGDTSLAAIAGRRRPGV